jgi:hypothetical protein
VCGLAAFPDGGPPSVLPAVATGECAQVRVVTHLWVAELGIGAARVASWLRDVVAGASTSSRCRVWWRRHNGCGDWTTVVRRRHNGCSDATTFATLWSRSGGCGDVGDVVATGPGGPAAPPRAGATRQCHPLAPVPPRAGATSRRCHPPVPPGSPGSSGSPPRHPSRHARTGRTARTRSTENTRSSSRRWHQAYIRPLTISMSEIVRVVVPPVDDV